MRISEIESKSILRKSKKVDSWFISRYGMNLYRGCSHNCAYCDGRAENYYVKGEFGKDVEVKTNAIELLKKELDPSRKRKPFDKSFILLGGGVCDSYEPVEKKYELTRQALELIYEFGHPVHILTKSDLIRRDIDLIKKINHKSKAIVSFSFSSVDDSISSIFEPGVSTPSKRLDALKEIKANGIQCGMFLMPVIPLITDTEEMILNSLNAAKDTNLDYVIFSGMTLKPGRQRDYYYRVLSKHYPDLVRKYKKFYLDDKWGSALPAYYEYIHKNFCAALKKEFISPRIPFEVFSPVLSDKNKIAVVLKHIEYVMKLRGQETKLNFAAKLFREMSDEDFVANKWKEHKRDMDELAIVTVEKFLSEEGAIDYKNYFY